MFHGRRMFGGNLAVGWNAALVARHFMDGFEGRLKLESSPGFVDWYEKRGLLVVSRQRIMHEGVKYTPMELAADRVSILLPDR